MEIGEEIYVLRAKIYGKDIKIYQKCKVVGIYPTYFRAKFDCKDEKCYYESFNKVTTRYKKELSENDRLF